MTDENTTPEKLGENLQSLLEELYGGDVNEATMTANILIPALRKLFGEAQLEAECTMSLQFGVNTVTIDTKRSSGVNGRADFFLRDRTTGKVVAVVEAKKPSHALNEADDEQVKSYMRAILPLVPYGIVVNANEPSRLFGWRDGDIIKFDESTQDPLSSFPASMDSGIVQVAVRALMRAIPAYRDNAISQISLRRLKTIGLPSNSPRAVVQCLVARIENREATVSFVTSPPKCGKSQVLIDLASKLLSSPIIFVEQQSAHHYALAEALENFEVDGETSDSLIARFLKARPSTCCPIYILIDASAHSQELIELISFLSETPQANAHLVIAASFQVVRQLLFRDDFTPFVDSNSAITIFEIGAFTDKELAELLPKCYVDIAKEPFGRLLRWPGLRSNVQQGKNMGETLCSWFQSCPHEIRLAMNILGSNLAQANDWSADRLPSTFVRSQPRELKILLEYGFVIELSRPRSGLSDFGFSCIEIALYAVLSHIFESADRSDRATAMDTFVGRWKRVHSEQEMIALTAILPTFLAGQSDAPLDRIVRYMLSISFGSYVLETISRSDLFLEYANSVDSQVASSKKTSFQRTSYEMLKEALLIFRDRVRLMPDFAELEQELGETARFFQGKHNPILDAKLSCEELEDHSILLKLGKTALLDSLYLLSIGNISWLPKDIDQETVRRIAVAIADAARPHRAGFPVESQIDYLVDIITRRDVRDLQLLLKSKYGSGDKLSTSQAHISYLAKLVIDAYAAGTWEFLSACFAYTSGMSADLLGVLINGFLEVGDHTSFVNVFINFPDHLFRECPKSIQKRILERLMDIGKNVAIVIAHLDRAVLQVIHKKHLKTFNLISELVWESGNTMSILRVMTCRGTVAKSVRENDFWRFVAQLDLTAISVALSTAEFFDEFFSVIPIPIVNLKVAMQSRPEKRGWETLLEAMCLLERNGEHLVDDENWLHELDGSTLVTEEWIRNAPDPEMEVRNTRWNVERCREYIRSRILQAMQQKELHQLDHMLKSALLNVHKSKFNRIYIRVAVEVTRESDADYRKRVARRLILSGFDLWENQIGYTCPMLRELLVEVTASLSSEEKDEWIGWILRHYHRLRLFPLFRTYSIRELMSLRKIREKFLEMELDKIPEDSRFLLPLVDISLASFGEHAEDLAVGMLKMIAASTEGIAGFRIRFPNEFQHIQSFVPKQDEMDMPVLSADEVLGAFKQAMDAVPQLPAVLPAWNDGTHIRSMLSPIEEGFRVYKRKEFKDSLTPIRPHAS